MLSCYGIRYNKQPECKSCDKQSYCKDAVYKSDSHNNVTYLDKDSQELPSQIKNKTELQQIADLLNEANHIINDVGADIVFTVMQSMHNIHKSRPVAFRIALKKILHPELSYSALSKECQVKSKQLIDYHLRQAAKVAPEISNAIIPYGYQSNRSTHFKQRRHNLFNNLLMYQPSLFDDAAAL